MPELGLGLGIDRQNKLPSIQQLLKQAGVGLALLPYKADGVRKGINSPFVNPWVDLSGNSNNATLTNFAATTADGWVDKLLPNGNTKPMLKFDGINSYGILPNNPSIDIVGLDEFEITKCFMTPSTLLSGQLIIKTLDGTTPNAQYGIFSGFDGVLAIQIGGQSITVGVANTLLPNTLYIVVVRRRLGRLIVLLNSVEIYNQPNVSSITSKPNFRIGARPNIADGSTHTLFTNVFDGGTLITKNPTDWAKLDKATKEAFKGYL